MANSEPKARKSTTAAAMIPTISLLEAGLCWVDSIADPPSATFSEPVEAFCAVSTRLCTCAPESCLPPSASSIVAYAVLPSALICAEVPEGGGAAEYGSAILATPDWWPIEASVADIRDSTGWARTVPESTCQTRVAESPLCAGNACVRSVSALVESVFGSENTLLYELPADIVAAPRPNSAAIHTRITTRRWVWHHRASAVTRSPWVEQRRA
jgi:hypothetical protein